MSYRWFPSKKKAEAFAMNKLATAVEMNTKAIEEKWKSRGWNGELAKGGGDSVRVVRISRILIIYFFIKYVSKIIIYFERMSSFYMKTSSNTMKFFNMTAKSFNIFNLNTLT